MLVGLPHGQFGQGSDPADRIWRVGLPVLVPFDMVR